MLYYSQYYTSNNFLNLQKLFDITEVDLNPTLNNDFLLGENLDGCKSGQSFCHVGNPDTLKLQILKGLNGNISINYYGFGNKLSTVLTTSCTKGGDDYYCNTYTTPDSEVGSSGYAWTETLTHKYIGNLTEAEIRDFANPNSSY